MPRVLPLLVLSAVVVTVGCHRFARKEEPRAVAVRATTAPYPIVLVHGFSGFTDLGPLLGSYFQGVKGLYEELGADVFQPNLPPYQSSEVRARHLARAVDEALEVTGAEKVHLVAHSQGGLDARYLLAALGYADRVASLTTISTPHRGTPLADVGLHTPDPFLEPLFWSLDLAMGAPEGVDLGDPRARGALRWMSTAHMRDFNARVPDPPDVPVFSVAGVTGESRPALCDDGAWGALDDLDAPDPKLVPSWLLLKRDLKRPEPNDGIVPTRSARWGHFLGCIAADHFDQVGWSLDLRGERATAFDHRAFYHDLYQRLRGLEATGDIGIVIAPPERETGRRRPVVDARRGAPRSPSRPLSASAD